MTSPTTPVLNPSEPSAAGPSTRPTRIETSMPSAAPPHVLPSSRSDFRARSWDGIAPDSIPPRSLRIPGSLSIMR